MCYCVGGCLWCIFVQLLKFWHWDIARFCGFWSGWVPTMPLLKKKPFTLLEPPKDLEPNELVYQVRFTKEIFRDYEYPSFKILQSYCMKFLIGFALWVISFLQFLIGPRKLCLVEVFFGILNNRIHIFVILVFLFLFCSQMDTTSSLFSIVWIRVSSNKIKGQKRFL